MIKRLLSAALIASTALGASAEDQFKLGDIVYSSGACYKIAGANLLSNSDFSNDFGGWTSINETGLDAVFSIEEGAGPAGEKVIKASGASSDGCYQAVAVPGPGTYVLTFNIKGNASGFTDVSRSNYLPFASGINYINLIYNADGTPTGATDRVELPLGEGGAFGVDDWSTVCLPIEVSAEEGFLIPEIAALDAGVQVTNVELYQATSVFDSRTAQNYKDYCQAIFDGYNWANDQTWEDNNGAPRQYVDNLQEALGALQTAIDNNSEIEGKLTTLQKTLESFLGENVDEILQYMGKGEGSATWANWSTKYNAFIGKNSPGGANNDLWANSINQYWRFNTDRWNHKNAALDTDLGIEWMRGSSGDWDNVATATFTLEPGTYFFGFEGEGGIASMNKNDWARSRATEAVYFDYWFNGDTIHGGALNPALRKHFIHGFTLDEKSTITLGIRCNNTKPEDGVAWKSAGNPGMFTKFYAPVLYKVFSGEGYSEQEKYYLEDVKVQLDELNNRLEDVLKAYTEDNSRPWGKNELKAAYDEYKGMYDTWTAMSDDEKLEFLQNDEVLADTIYQSAGKPIKDVAKANWLALNAPFTNLVDTIKAANIVYEDPAYELYDRPTFKSAIDNAQGVYDTKLGAATSDFVQADSLALREAAHELILAIDAFKNSLTQEAILDVDFETPATKNEDETYSVVGNKGQMDFANGAFEVWNKETKDGVAEDWNTSTKCVQGFWNGETDTNPGVLRVGNSSGTASIADEDLPAVATTESQLGDKVDLVYVSFDVYYGYLDGKNLWFTLKDTEGETIVSETLGAGTWDDQLGVGGIYNSVGSKAEYDVTIYTKNGNKSHFDILMNYGSQLMTATMTNGNGSVTVDSIKMNSIKPLKTFELGSNYNNGSRRSWFDNLLVTVVRNGAKVTNVPAPDFILGDVNNDNEITMADANAVVNYFLAEDKPAGFNLNAANVNGDFEEDGTTPAITMSDANAIVNMYLNSNTNGDNE